MTHRFARFKFFASNSDYKCVSECPVCNIRLVTITMKLVDSELLMQSCSRCDRRFWQVDGKDIEFTGVLGREPVRQPALR